MNRTRVPPSISYSFTIRLVYPNQIGMLARIAGAIGKHGGDIGAVDIVASDSKSMTRDITVRARDTVHQEELIARVRRLPGVKVINVSDRVFLLHLGGKIAIQNKVPLVTRDALSMAYTPGRGACLRGHCRPTPQGLAAYHQGQLRRRGQRRHRRAGPG